MLKNYLLTISISFLLITPALASALQMPKNGNELGDMAGLTAKAYFVQDVKTGQVLISKNPELAWPPASLTKLVTVLVVLDTHPKLTKTVVVTNDDQVLGQCKSGGSCVKAKAGVKFTVDGLFHAALMPSANNAAAALARSTGLSMEKFAARMNQKVASLGALNSHFNEPTGLDPANTITASDYAKIVATAFQDPYLKKIGGLSSYLLRSSNNFSYNQTIKNSDKLLADADITMLGAKTGYLDESLYNFGSLLKYRDGTELAVVVLGEDHLFSAFAETKELASLAEAARSLALQNTAGAVLGANSH